MNQTRQIMQDIFGARMPATATRFFTVGDAVFFDGGRLRSLRRVAMNKAQRLAMQRRGFLGASGWAMQ